MAVHSVCGKREFVKEYVVFHKHPHRINWYPVRHATFSIRFARLLTDTWPKLVPFGTQTVDQMPVASANLIWKASLSSLPDASLSRWSSFVRYQMPIRTDARHTAMMLYEPYASYSLLHPPQPPQPPEFMGTADEISYIPYREQIAWADIPSSEPVKPSPSSVVALIFTWSFAI